jgi:hypothetical protein
MEDFTGRRVIPGFLVPHGNWQGHAWFRRAFDYTGARKRRSTGGI